MAGIGNGIFSVLNRTQSTQGGIISQFTGPNGILSFAPLQARIQAIQAAPTLQAKLQAFTSTLGTRLRTLHLGPSGSSTSTWRGPFRAALGSTQGSTSTSAGPIRAQYQDTPTRPVTPPAGTPSPTPTQKVAFGLR